MRDFARQVRALTGLIWKNLRRRAIKVGANPRAGGPPTFLLFLAASLLYTAVFGWRRFSEAAAYASHRDEAIGWQLDGILLALLAGGLLDVQPEFGRVRSPLRAALLDELPVSAAAQVALMWGRSAYFGGVPVLAFLAWSPSLRGQPPMVAALVGLGLLLFLAASTSGYAIAVWARVWLGPPGLRLFWQASTGVMVSAMPLILLAGPLRDLVSPGPTLAFARALASGHGLGLLAGKTALVLVLAAGAIALGEQVGYDRVDAAAARKRRAEGGRLTLEATERRLQWREAGRALLFIQLSALLGVCGVALRAMLRHDASVRDLLLPWSLVVAYLGALIALNQAGQGARRDAGVRALLAPLPIAPYELLAGKVRAVRRSLLPLLVTAVPMALLVVWNAPALGLSTAAGMVARIGITTLAVWLGIDAAVSVAFLSNGLGLPGMRSLGAPTSLMPQLLLLPLLATAASPTVPLELAALASVAAVTFEARRAAGRAVRWLDDASDEVERETSVWRALLALAAFFAAQALAAQLLRISSVTATVLMSITYAVAAVVLVLLTLSGRRGLPALRFLPARGALLWQLAGLVAGVGSGALALGFGRLALWLGWLGDQAQAPEPTGAAAAILFAVIGCGVAPVAEELFFRGWLQSAIAVDLGERRRRWAFVVAAAAFAFGHVGGLVVPQLVLGLAAGALFARTGALGPGLFAHVAHNALVLGVSLAAK